MRKLALLPLLTLAIACNDNTLVQPDESLAPEIAATRAAPMMVPLKAHGTYLWDGIWPPPAGQIGCDPSRPADETVFIIITADLQVTHLGKTSGEVVECYDAATWALLYDQLTLTGADGDGLVLLYTTFTPPPDGFDWGFNFDITGGTGRFEGATGSGVIFGAGFVSGATGIDGIVSAPGTIQ